MNLCMWIHVVVSGCTFVVSGCTFVEGLCHRMAHIQAMRASWCKIEIPTADVETGYSACYSKAGMEEG